MADREEATAAAAAPEHDDDGGEANVSSTRRDDDEEGGAAISDGDGVPSSSVIIGTSPEAETTKAAKEEGSDAGEATTAVPVVVPVAAAAEEEEGASSSSSSSIRPNLLLGEETKELSAVLDRYSARSLPPVGTERAPPAIANEGIVGNNVCGDDDDSVVAAPGDDGDAAVDMDDWAEHDGSHSNGRRSGAAGGAPKSRISRRLLGIGTGGGHNNKGANDDALILKSEEGGDKEGRRRRESLHVHVDVDRRSARLSSSAGGSTAQTRLSAVSGVQKLWDKMTQKRLNDIDALEQDDYDESPRRRGGGAPGGSTSGGDGGGGGDQQSLRTSCKYLWINLYARFKVSLQMNYAVIKSHPYIPLCTVLVFLLCCTASIGTTLHLSNQYEEDTKQVAHHYGLMGRQLIMDQMDTTLESLHALLHGVHEDEALRELPFLIGVGDEVGSRPFLPLDAIEKKKDEEKDGAHASGEEHGTSTATAGHNHRHRERTLHVPAAGHGLEEGHGGTSSAPARRHRFETRTVAARDHHHIEDERRGDETHHYSYLRNVTGICDSPSLVQTFHASTSTVRHAAFLHGVVIHHATLAPYGVACLSSPNFDESGYQLGQDMFADPKYVDVAHQALASEGALFSGPFRVHRTENEEEGGDGDDGNHGDEDGSDASGHVGHRVRSRRGAVHDHGDGAGGEEGGSGAETHTDGDDNHDRHKEYYNVWLMHIPIDMPPELGYQMNNHWGIMTVSVDWDEFLHESGIFPFYDQHDGLEFVIVRNGGGDDGGEGEHDDEDGGHEEEGGGEYLAQSEGASDVDPKHFTHLELDYRDTDEKWTLGVGVTDGYRPSWFGLGIGLSLMLSFLVSLMFLTILVTWQGHKDLLLGMIPRKALSKIRRGEVYAEQFDMVTVFFSDIVGYTNMTAEMRPLDVMKMLNAFFREVDKLADKHGVYKVETIGDAYMCVGGCPDRCMASEGAQKVALFALDMIDLCEDFRLDNGSKLLVRCGLNSGRVVTGVVGTKLPHFSLFGDTVNTASRMESTSETMMIQCSDVTARLLRDAPDCNFDMSERGSVKVKGKGEMNTWWIHGKAERDDVETGHRTSLFRRKTCKL